MSNSESNGFVVVNDENDHQNECHMDNKQEDITSESNVIIEENEQSCDYNEEDHQEVTSTTRVLSDEVEQPSELNEEKKHEKTLETKLDNDEQKIEIIEIRIKNKTSEAKKCNLCPYYLFACDYFTKLQVPPIVSDMVLWKCPKMTGAVFGSSFVLLLSLSLFSILTVISTSMLTALTIVGATRLYLAIMFKIKGTYDDSLEKLAKQEVPLSKERIEELFRFIEKDLFRFLNSLKSLILWENVMQSIKALVAFFLVNWVGSCFNLLTLLMVALVTVFTLPKVYQTYKVQIDQSIEKATIFAHEMSKQLMEKIPMLNKKKVQ